MRQVWNLESGLIEVIKYGAKIFTEPDLDQKTQGNVNPTIYAAALYNIFDGMKDLRLFERFGFNLPKSDKPTTPARVVTEYDEWLFCPEYHDWMQLDSEQVLSDYCMSAELADLLCNYIDTQAE